MYRKIKEKILDGYRKNGDDIRALVYRIYPEFIYKDTNALEKGQIPVFTIHSVDPYRLDLQLKHLAQNNYKTLTADQLHRILTGKQQPEANTVVLTFDDGLGSLWSVAYPLLKKYELHAVAFIVPGAVPDEPACYANLEEVWAGRADIEGVIMREQSAPLCSWTEIRVMQESGIIDFQSHTTYHNSLFVNDKLVDFINPYLSPSFICSTFNPVIRRNGNDEFLSQLEWGYPIYIWGSAMSSQTRYLEDEGLSQYCVQYVQRNGGSSFFERPRWRGLLKRCVEDFERTYGKRGRFQSRQERFEELCSDLAISKEIIEAKLGTVVRHLCYPWYKGSAMAVDASRRAGYISNYWGIMQKRAINRVGDDPYYLSRIDEDYILRLPGEGRRELTKILADKVCRVMSRAKTTQVG